MSKMSGSACSFQARNSTQPGAVTRSDRSTSALRRSPTSAQVADHLALLHQLQVIHGHDRAHEALHVQVGPARGHFDFAAGRFAVDGQAEQCTVGRHGVACLERLQPVLQARVQFRGSGVVRVVNPVLHEYAVQPHRTAQRGEVGHRIGAAGRRYSEAAVEQSMPDFGRGAVIV